MHIEQNFLIKLFNISQKIKNKQTCLKEDFFLTIKYEITPVIKEEIRKLEILIENDNLTQEQSEALNSIQTYFLTIQQNIVEINRTN